MKDYGGDAADDSNAELSLRKDGSFRSGARDLADGHGFLLIINGFVKFEGRPAGCTPMKTMARDVDAADDASASDANFKPLSAEQAQRLRERKPLVSPWRVIAVQAASGFLVALVAWGLSGERSWGWSAGYGALAVVIPSAIFARGLTGRFSSLNPGTAVVGFFVWELVKMALTIAMLIAAPRLVVALSWPALLVGLVVTMKSAWVAVMLKPRSRTEKRETDGC